MWAKYHRRNICNSWQTVNSLLILEDLNSSWSCWRMSLRGNFIWKLSIEINLTSDRYFRVFGISFISFGGMETRISGTCGMSSRVMNRKCGVSLQQCEAPQTADKNWPYLTPFLHIVQASWRNYQKIWLSTTWWRLWDFQCAGVDQFANIWFK